MPPAEALRYTGYKPFAVGESWGPPWGTTWFHLTGDVPVPDGELEIVVDLGWSDPRDAGAGKAHRRSGRLATGGGRAAVEAGYQLNLPLRSVIGDAGVPPLVTVGEGVVVEALKLADDRSGDLVIRLYESLGRRARVRLGAGFPVRGVVETDLLERPMATDALLSFDDGGADLALRPFQIVTLRVEAG